MQTGDGYLLGLHRLCWRKGEESLRVNAGHGSVQKEVVYLHHGLLMNSEVWVCMTEKERCLPFMLVERGYDVWVCQSNESSKFYTRLAKADQYSWGTIVGISIRRSPLASPLLPTTSGISQWTNSRFTIFLTASTTFLQRLLSHLSPT